MGFEPEVLNLELGGLLLVLSPHICSLGLSSGHPIARSEVCLEPTLPQ